jgi:hypothetical protein
MATLLSPFVSSVVETLRTSLSTSLEANGGWV